MYEVDTAGITVDRYSLSLDCERFQAEIEEREKRRRFHREERAARDKPELENFKIMMRTFTYIYF